MERSRVGRRGSAFALVALLVPLLGAMPAQPESFAFSELGGYRGNAYVTHRDGDAYEYSEDVALTFSHAVDLASFRASYTISPQTPSSVYPWEYGRRIAITMRKVPGVTYTITVAPTLTDTDGRQLGKSISVRLTTPADPVIPAPLRATPDEPYRYGVLAHPFPFSLTGRTARRQMDLMQRAGVRFVRIDYCGTQIEPDPGRWDWSIPDRIAGELARRGITELPIVEQYCAPKWATGGRGYPAIWMEPSAYADFAGAIAAHIAHRYPAINRMELFNEPNLHGWWSNPNPQYAARDGSATGVYMKAAYAAVKQSAPGMTVVGPALADGGSDTDPRKFFEAMYESGCRRGVCWDVLSVHNYRWYNPTFSTKPSYQNQWSVYRQLQEIAARHGDPSTHVMLTEWGFSTIDSPVGFDPKVQAWYVALGFNLMLADPTVDGIVYVNLYNPATDFWGRTALTTPDFQPLPGMDVFRAFAAAGEKTSRR
ncbi:hypothetical protein EPN44_04715 [bacterium]|nr:MAG: hypothetical protein EPN44_04715 [bacterium]